MSKINMVSSFSSQRLILAFAFMVLAVLPFGSARAESNAGLGVEVNIGTNGNVLVRGAKVISVTGADITANTAWGATNLGWTIHTASSTDFVNKGGHNMGIADIAVGDIISFRGPLDQTISGLRVNAKIVKDWSKTQAQTKLNGTVGSINTTLNSFTVLSGRATTTVQTNSSTKFSKNGKASSFSEIILSAKVKILGLFNASSTVFTALAVEIEKPKKNDNDDSWNDDDDHGKWLRGWIRGNVFLNLFGKKDD